MKHSYLIACALLAVTTAPLPVYASHGYVPKTVNLRSGPGTMYPIVNNIPGNVIVDINGCLRDSGWCEVTWSGKEKKHRNHIEHGWVSERFLQSAFRDEDGRYTIRPHQQMRVPVIGFDIINYWDQYYRDEDFYEDRQHYVRNSGKNSSNHQNYNNRKSRKHWNIDENEWNERQSNNDDRNQNREYRNYWNN